MFGSFVPYVNARSADHRPRPAQAVPHRGLEARRRPPAVAGGRVEAGLTQADIEAQLDDADQNATPNWSSEDFMYLEVKRTGKTRDQILAEGALRQAEAGATVGCDS